MKCKNCEHEICQIENSSKLWLHYAGKLLQLKYTRDGKPVSSVHAVALAHKQYDHRAVHTLALYISMLLIVILL